MKRTEAAPREIRDDTGRLWAATSVDTPVAHVKTGARLAFRPVDQPESEPLLTPVTFNSHEAASFAIRTMSDKELLRRLSLASLAAGGLPNDAITPPAP